MKHLELVSEPLKKYPRTPHVAGSRLQKGDDPSDQVPWSALAGCYVVIEEKIDGANVAMSFGTGGDLRLQSRGHYLVGGSRERQFNALKPWAAAHENALLERLEDHLVVFGEWTYAKHAIFYDHLPHHFHEFDVYDRRTETFWSTHRRHTLWANSPILPVPVLYQGVLPKRPEDVLRLVQKALAKSTSWRAAFEKRVHQNRWPLELCWRQTDASDQSEGLYIKVEDDHKVVARYKWVRQDFVQAIVDSESHHLDRPLLPNDLAPGVDLFAPTPTITWHDLGLQTLTSPEELEAWWSCRTHDQGHRAKKTRSP